MEINTQIQELEKELSEKKKALAELRRKANPKEIANYGFLDFDGKEVKLHELFGDKREMLLAFNMGKGCRYCTLWADGFVGLSGHLSDRAAFVVVSPDAPEVQQEFYNSRNWNFPMYSRKNNTIAADLKMQSEDGKAWPGIVALSLTDDGRILMHSSTYFGPGDNYSIMWDMMDLLPEGWAKWQPQYSYS